jgi:hypothetical protein
MKPPPLQGKSPILRGGLAPWDSLPDCRHPVAWAYLARGVLHLIKPPPHVVIRAYLARGTFT